MVLHFQYNHTTLEIQFLTNFFNFFNFFLLLDFLEQEQSLFDIWRILSDVHRVYMLGNVFLGRDQCRVGLERAI